MRPPILVITVAFGVGLWAGGSELGGWGSGLAVLAVAAGLARQAPLGAAVGVVGVAGLLWGAAARRQHEATCEGRWKGNGTRAAIVRLGDPAPDSGGPVEADVVEGRCGGALRLRWPDGIPARGGTTWVVAGWWVGSDGHGVLVVRRAKLLDAEPRARAMLVVDDVARLRQRVAAPRGVIALSALAVLLVDPLALYSIGAWLSVSAIAAVIWAGRATARGHWAVRALAPAAAATLLTAPITAFAFGTVAPIGVLANLIAIPLGAIVVPGLVFTFAVSWVLPGLASLLAAGSGLGLALLDLTAQGAAAVPGGHVIMVAGWEAAAVWLAVAVAGWWLWNSPRRPSLIAARVAFLTTVLVVTTFRDVVTLDECRCLTVSFLDVGQGDAAVLRTPNSRWVVSDGGPRIPGSDAGRLVVVPFLRRHGAQRLAVVVATHGDADHLGGLPAVVEALTPELVLEPGEPLGRPLYLEFLAAVEGSGARWHPARAGDRIEVDGVVLEVLSPDSVWMTLPLDVNEHGVVLRVTFGATRLLFQADAGLPVEGHLAGRVGRVELLKVGHHGSSTATSDAWRGERRPREAVISVGAHNHYGHPAPEVLDRLRHWGSEIFRTDQAGTITLTTDGQRTHIDVRRHD